jgi:SNF2 family DNA or RNA helicase
MQIAVQTSAVDDGGSGADGAVSSPGASPKGRGSMPALAQWQVRGLALEPVHAARFLVSLPVDGEVEHPHIMLGADVRFWSAAAKLSLELLARQRLAPSLERVGESFEARWRPILDDPRDAGRLVVLARSQPPAAHALISSPDESTGGTQVHSSRALLQAFVEATVDALARAWLAAEADRRPALEATTASRAWLHSLRRGQTAVRASSVDLERLAADLAEWRAPLASPASGSPYRTCFRLEAPFGDGQTGGRGDRETEADHPWTLCILLQASDDPSLLVPAERVWSERGGMLVYLNRRFDQPQERLLADLGRAVRSFGPLDRCLAEAQPTECPLTAEEAYQFLREAAWLLEENGFGILVPSWWDRRGPRGRLGLRLRMRPAEGGAETSRGLVGSQAIVEYDWRLAVGQTELSEAEFRQLAALKVPLVCVRGQWVELRPDKIEQAITFWEKQAQAAAAGNGQSLPTNELLPMALGSDEIGGLPILGVEADGWVAQLLGEGNGADGLSQATVSPVPTPAAFVGELRPYQERGVGWLTFLSERGLGACLADDMGLGKTVQYIAFLLHRRAQARSAARLVGAEGAKAPTTNPKPALLICPTSVVGNWRHELERFAPGLRVLVHHGQDRLIGSELRTAAYEHDLVISSYALVHRDREALASVAWDGVVLDEAQNVKNPDTLQARAARALKATYRFALTGTPIENRLAELWSIVEFLNPGYLGSRNGFRQRFVTPIERWQDPERAEQLRRLVRPLVLRRLKTDRTIIDDLPEKLEMKVFCTLTPEQATLYQAVVADMLRQIEASEGIQRRGLVLATLTRLKQVCNHPAHFLADGSALAGRSGKLERLQEMLDEVLAEGDRALVFTQFAELGGRLREHLQSHFGQEVLFLHGGVAAERRDALVRRFQEDSLGPRIFILSLRAGGIGLNLTNANHVFHFDRWWNPAVEDQATDRVFRIGQRRNVQVHKFVCAGTLEERIDALIEGKKALAEQVVGAGEAWLTELSTAELRDLVALRASAVVE